MYHIMTFALATASLFTALITCAHTANAEQSQPPAGVTAKTTPEPGNERLLQARKAVKQLAQALKSQLVSAIKSGGPVAAIPVCNAVAQTLAEQVSQEHGLTIRRTALRLRNQQNAPDDVERAAMQMFEQALSDGADPKTLEHTATTSENGKTTFRYLKAIPTSKKPCLACHGSDLDAELKAEIDRLYPNDQATGFKEGDMRGAFSVRIELP